MKLRKINIHNFRSAIDLEIEVNNYMLLVGANNSGKSTILNALRVFYEDTKWSSEDFPITGATDNESWIELNFLLDKDEWDGLADKYKAGVTDQKLTVRRYLKSDDKARVQKDQSNIFGLVNGNFENDLFYGAKNVGSAKIGQVIYVPALTTPSEQTKMSGPSPLRHMLNFLLKKVVSKSAAYKEITDAFEKLNTDARKQDGFLSEISEPLNTAISSWDIKIDLSVNTVAPEDISKSLIKFAFIDAALGNVGLDLEQYGHGFQRSVIYELIRLAPTFKDEKKADKKEFNPNFTLILFEEPEAFLHPSQQETMAYHLRKLAEADGQQVIITTHSPIFAGKAAEEIGQLVRVNRSNGVTQVFQPKDQQITALFQTGGELLIALTTFVNNQNIAAQQKKRAQNLINNPPQGNIAIQEEQFRYQMWLDSERASLFFADKVLLVEGATERALFNYLLANSWHDLSSHHICVIDVFGKFNFHRFMALLSAYGISHGVMLDDDNNNEHHGAINDLVDNSKNKFTLSTPIKFNNCLESFLGLAIPDANRKPLEMMKAVTGNQIDINKLDALKALFKETLAI
jgi:putative ATP-dependent endonuclease of the OLD family